MSVVIQLGSRRREVRTSIVPAQKKAIEALISKHRWLAEIKPGAAVVLERLLDDLLAECVDGRVKEKSAFGRWVDQKRDEDDAVGA